MRTLLLVIPLWLFGASASAQIGSSGTGDDRWNVSGPDPDVPCERMANADTAGPLQRTYIKRWD